MAQKILMNIAMFLFVIAFVGCDKSEDVYSLDVNSSSAEVVFSTSRDAENATIKASKLIGNGVRQDTVITIPLGGVTFQINGADTIDVVAPVVERKSLQEGEAKTDEYEENGVFYTKTSRSYRDELSVYAKEIKISYLDAYTYVWGKRISLPEAKGKVSAEEAIQIADNGIKGANHFFTSTTSYKVAFMEGSRVEKGVEVLKTKADDTLISVEKTNEGYETLSPSTAKSWVEITRTYKVSGKVATKYEVVLNNNIVAPEFESMQVKDFNLVLKASNLNEAVSTNREEGNIKVTSYSQNFVVANNVFDRTFVLSYETAKLVIDNKEFDMPSRKYENITDGRFNLTDSEAIEGFTCKMYVHKMNASFNGKNVGAEAKVQLKKVEEKDEIKSQTIVESGVDYVNSSTTKSWIKVKEVWAIGGEKIYTKSVNLTNGIVSPSKITKVLDNFNLQSTSPSLSGEKLVNTVTSGEFKVMTYERAYRVANNKFDRVFVLRYQKAYYAPLKCDMPFVEYQNLNDNGFNMTDLSANSAQQYDRKNYVHNISAIFNNHSVSAVAEAELMVAKEDDRETPSWLGAPKGAKYTRVQQSVGSKFMDMIVFQYENGVVMAPNGVVDMNLAYAFDNSVAAANGVDKCISGAYSGVFGNGKWQPATISEIGGRWIYAGISSSWDHTVMELEAVALGIGVDVTSTPKNQNTTVVGNKITISYAANNGSNVMNSSLSLR